MSTAVEEAPRPRRRRPQPRRPRRPRAHRPTNLRPPRRRRRPAPRRIPRSSRRRDLRKSTPRAKGFDFHCSTKLKKLFGRGAEQRIAVRFVPVVDRAAVQDTWALAQKAGGEVCVLLMGSGMATAKELGDAISDMRRKSRGDGGISIIPIDLRDWSAHIPEDAPPACKNILLRLRESKS